MIGGVTTNDFSEIVLSPLCRQADTFQGEILLGSLIYLISRI
jgi:hypothetical protein